MVQKEYIFHFLRDLSNNNSKDWMDNNRNRYYIAKERWIEEVDLILKRLVKHDNYFQRFKPKDALSRINNNRRFHPDKPVYKDYFTCSPATKEDAISRIHISVGISGSFAGGGLHRPEKENLDKIRGAIDYDGEELLEIINDEEFQKVFGGLAEMGEKLKTSPHGYSNDHKYVELLRYKNYLAKKDFTQKEVASEQFIDRVEECYLTLRALNKFLEKALSV